MGIDFPRIAITPLTEKDAVRYGVFVGLLSNESSCDRCSDSGLSAVVSLDGSGLVLITVHVSRVTFINGGAR